MSEARDHILSKALTVSTVGEANALLARLRDSAEVTVTRLRQLINQEPEPLRVLSQLKFNQVGCDPLSPARCLNIIEQLNQIFTYQASFQAAAFLIQRYPAHAPLVLNLGAASGSDIVSEGGELVAEVFASVDPRNNRKLTTEIERLRLSAAPVRYIFYLSPKCDPRGDEFSVDGISIRRLCL